MRKYPDEVYKYPGKWISLSNDMKTVLGISDHLDVAIKIAHELGTPCPHILKVPEKGEVIN